MVVPIDDENHESVTVALGTNCFVGTDDVSVNVFCLARFEFHNGYEYRDLLIDVNAFSLSQPVFVWTLL